MMMMMMTISQELLFCESCDSVFCSLCTGGSHARADLSERWLIDEDDEYDNDDNDNWKYGDIIIIMTISMMMMLRNYTAKKCESVIVKCVFFLIHTNHKFSKSLEYFHTGLKRKSSYFTLELLARRRFLTFIPKSETPSLKLRHD